MSRKEDILYAALELSSQYGSKAVSLSQIADKVGIRKPSLYNHFRSKDELMSAMYLFLREQAHKSASRSMPESGAELFEGRSLAEILMMSFERYSSFIADKNMLSFFRVLYSERASSPAAAQIMLDETESMINSVKTLFYALVVHGKMKNENVDTAAVSYAMTIHSLIDREMDKVTAGKGTDGIPQDIRDYIQWFAKVMEA